MKTEATRLFVEVLNCTDELSTPKKHNAKLITISIKFYEKKSTVPLRR